MIEKFIQKIAFEKLAINIRDERNYTISSKNNGYALDEQKNMDDRDAKISGMIGGTIAAPVGVVGGAKLYSKAKNKALKKAWQQKGKEYSEEAAEKLFRKGIDYAANHGKIPNVSLSEDVVKAIGTKAQKLNDKGILNVKNISRARGAALGAGAAITVGRGVGKMISTGKTMDRYEKGNDIKLSGGRRMLAYTMPRTFKPGDLAADQINYNRAKARIDAEKEKGLK